ncbi:MAG TPA: STAS domain-containing protein [Streptosporangiaceae bacterium]|nr:STAS domain-containing protein [Streptosporangiaceae bacterium]
MGDEVLRITRAGDQPGLIIAGEIDESGYPLLLQSLAALDPEGDVHFDLSGVEFCDLAGLRAIVCVAAPDDDCPARKVTLHAVPARLRKILQILGWDVMPGVAFDDRGLPAPRATPPHHQWYAPHH